MVRVLLFILIGFFLILIVNLILLNRSWSFYYLVGCYIKDEFFYVSIDVHAGDCDMVRSLT